MPWLGPALLSVVCAGLRLGCTMPWFGCAVSVLVCPRPHTELCSATTWTCDAVGRTCGTTGCCAGCRHCLRRHEGAVLRRGQGQLSSPSLPQGRPVGCSRPLHNCCVSHRCCHVQPATWTPCVSEGSWECAGGCDKAPARGGVRTALLRGPSSCRSRFHFLPVPACAAQLHAVQQLPPSILLRDERCFISGRTL